jgi:stage III sporulation protein SpoIIIAA
MKPNSIGHSADAPEAISVDGIGVALDASRLTAAVVGVQLDVVAVGEKLAEAFLIGLRPIQYGLHD